MKTCNEIAREIGADFLVFVRQSTKKYPNYSISIETRDGKTILKVKTKDGREEGSLSLI